LQNLLRGRYSCCYFFVAANAAAVAAAKEACDSRSCCNIHGIDAYELFAVVASFVLPLVV